ncbi:MAG: CsbD family protein [Chloroflexota bacterium]
MSEQKNETREDRQDKSAIWDNIDSNWTQFQGKMKERWGKLTDDDLIIIAGKRDQLVGKLQKRYNMAQDEANRQIDEWAEKLKL